MNKMILVVFLSANAFGITNPLDMIPNPFDKSRVAAVEQQQKRHGQEIYRLKSKIEEQSIRIDGLTSLNAGLMNNVNSLKNKKCPQPKDNSKLIMELGKMIDEINSKYVSKEDLKTLVEKTENKINRKKDTVSKKKTNNIEVAELKGDSKDLYSKGVSLFYKKKYDEAAPIFLELSKRKHREYSTSFFLGEIHYYNNRYDEAIGYYKQSIGEKGDGKYTTLLLYHSAYALEMTDRKQQAITFYKSLVSDYTGNYSKLAKKRLDQLM